MIEPTDISFKIAKTDKDFEDGRNIFQQYADFIGLDLSFQDFAGELKTIGQQYNQPKGALLLAYHSDQIAGCVAIREIDSETAELKRMFVRKEYQGNKIGEKMLTLIISIAKDLKYKLIRLDTLPTMKSAQKLYQSYGFYEIGAYRFNPVEGTAYMEKKLF